MLARTTLTAAELGIPEAWRKALEEVAEDLETERLPYARKKDSDILSNSGYISSAKISFNMVPVAWEFDCGTVCCIAGAMALKLDRNPQQFYDEATLHSELQKLFLGRFATQGILEIHQIQPVEAAFAIRAFLATGECPDPAPFTIHQPGPPTQTP